MYLHLLLSVWNVHYNQLSIISFLCVSLEPIYFSVKFLNNYLISSPHNPIHSNYICLIYLYPDIKFRVEADLSVNHISDSNQIIITVVCFVDEHYNVL